MLFIIGSPFSHSTPVIPLLIPPADIEAIQHFSTVGRESHRARYLSTGSAQNEVGLLPPAPKATPL